TKKSRRRCATRWTNKANGWRGTTGARNRSRARSKREGTIRLLRARRHIHLLRARHLEVPCSRRSAKKSRRGAIGATTGAARRTTACYAGGLSSNILCNPLTPCAAPFRADLTEQLLAGLGN